MISPTKVIAVVCDNSNDGVPINNQVEEQFKTTVGVRAPMMLAITFTIQHRPIYGEHLLHTFSNTKAPVTINNGSVSGTYGLPTTSTLASITHDKTNTFNTNLPDRSR